MKDLKNDLSVLEQANWMKTDYGLYYKKDKIKFIKLKSRQSLGDVIKLIDSLDISERLGVICDELKESDLSLLREKKISYLVDGSEMKIFGPNRRHHLKRADIPATLLVSPTGLEIVDAIIRLELIELKGVSPTKLCKKFKLSRPKLSHIMNAFEVNNLIDLKNKLLNLELSWWMQAFDNPMTRRKMTPFQIKKTRRYTLKNDLDDVEFRGLVESLKDQNIELEIGGMSYLKILGALRTQEFDLIVRADQIFDVVEKMNLRPARKDEWLGSVFITPIRGDLEQERLYTKIINDQEGDFSLEKLNPLRFIWGLNYAESRVREEKKNLLEKYFYEARASNNRIMETQT